MKKVALLSLALGAANLLFAQSDRGEDLTDKFAQLGPELATPNAFRTASGAPGVMYWQQEANYNIQVELDDENQRLKGSEVIHYTNNSPDPLTYIWVQLDQNRFKNNSDTYSTASSRIPKRMSFSHLESILPKDTDHGYNITKVADINGNPLAHVINKTMMRVDLPQPLHQGDSFDLAIDWEHHIIDAEKMDVRGGYEYFPEDKNYLYEISQWFPRMAVYSDFEGWQNKQFLGNGEFALPFGDYTVSITAPADHIVGATGVLQNPEDVLNAEQLKRFNQAKTADKPVLIVSQKEAEKNEKSRSKEKKTWTFKADNVRDFAWASSRKFIWDAMGVKMENGKTTMAMSFYPKEGNPLWGQYSTEVVAHTLKTYSDFTFAYPYPTAISVHGPVFGMEYPMICFNGGRPESDGTYSETIKNAMIGVIIHEVGHNFFPMIVNSDERQWTWMDEGLNTFLEYLTEVSWDRDFPTDRGPASSIVRYMKGSRQFMRPIMTNSEAIIQFGNNAYGKPAAALNILRETVMGRELFDYALKEYAKRWAFKHPTPEDFFRTMEDASGVDLDWFWRGWFYTTDNVDISIEDMKWFKVNTQNPVAEKKDLKKEHKNALALDISRTQNMKDIPKTAVEANSELKDFYNSYDPFKITTEDTKAYKKFLKGLDDNQKELLNAGLNFYQIDFKNIGGLVMPIIIKWTYTDGSSEVERIPAEIWRMNNDEVSKVFAKKKEVAEVELDPYLETADVDRENNYFPRRNVPTKFKLYKRKKRNSGNPMQKKNKAISSR
ncbi:M1 family metallopeptidase [Xanthovirga aplysinae]|uniref:M1 family metallopeptidase n=1 Tax=Xanthovirga aplysinae TaxID=2529853 RepID=UPI0012BBD062|nr:M1 family metallopeptidase [Xanthovirga aplysinae]MTI30044.1 M1 family peptidase [Xanthovirga aplysinae]